MPMTQNPAYWSDLPTRLPWRYKYRTSVGRDLTLEVAGPARGTRHRARLLCALPWGGIRPIWTEEFRTPKNPAEASLKQSAAILLISACSSEPALADKRVFQEARENARRVLAALADE